VLLDPDSGSWESCPFNVVPDCRQDHISNILMIPPPQKEKTDSNA